MIKERATALSASYAVLTAMLSANPIVFDGSLGPSGAIQPTNGTFQIAPQEHSIRGVNLLHSFSEFSIPPNMTADFSGPAGIQSIIAKVTGGRISNIEGTLKSSIPNADFYLINPAGIIFSKSAKLNLSGSFTATTADQLIDGDGKLFSVIGSSDSILRVAPLADFGFTKPSASLPANQGVIASSANMQLPSGNLRLVGRQVLLDSATISSGKNLQITAVGDGATTVRVETSIPDAVAGNASVHINKSLLVPGGLGRELEIRGSDIHVTDSSLNFRNFQTTTPASVRMVSSKDITLDQGTIVASVSGLGAGANTMDLSAAGKITIDRSLVTTFTPTTATAGAISVAASSLDIIGNADGVEWGIVSASAASGKGGELSLQIRNQTNISNGGLIASIAFAQGDAGNLTFKTDSLQITGLVGVVEPNAFLTGLVGVSQGTGKGGNITVEAGDIHLIQGGLIDSSAFVSGRGGDISVNSRNLTIDRMGSRFFTGIGSDAEGTASAGMIKVTSGTVILNNGGLISSSTSGTGNAGDVSVNAEEIIIKGEGAASPFVVTRSSGIVASTAIGSAGNGGRINVSADHILRIENGGVIGAESLGSGAGGMVSVNAASINLLGGGNITSSASGSGVAGDILISTGNFDINGSEIGVRAANAKAGNLIVTASGDIRMIGGLMTATAGGRGNAGDIVIHSRNVLLSGSSAAGDSGIVASTQAGSSGRGGSVKVTATANLVVRNGAQIGAESLGSGAGGLVEVSAPSTRLLTGGRISSNATGGGNSGGVSLVTGNLEVNHGEIGVRSTMADAGNIGIYSTNGITLTSALITASAGDSGGNIAIRAQDIIQITDSAIVAEADSDGGNINISIAPHLILNQSQISANAVNGSGGRIDLTTGTFFSNQSSVTASSEFGIQGVVRIDPLVSFSGGEESEEPALLNPNDILQPDCVNRVPDTGSSFTKAGRGGTPRLPGGYLPSFRIIE